MYEAWLPRHPMRFSCLLHELMGRNVEGQRRFLCSIVRWVLFYNKLHMPDQQHQNYKAAAWHNGWTFVKPLLSKSTVQNIIYFCLYIQNKDIFHLFFFFPPSVIHPFLQPSNIFVSVQFLLHSMSWYYFSIFLFRYFASFSHSTTLLFSVLLFLSTQQLYFLLLWEPYFHSDAVLQCCLTPPVHPKTVLFVCQNLTYRDLPFRKYSPKKRHLVFLKTPWSKSLVCGMHSLTRLSEEIHMLLKITHVPIFTQKLK